jgi:hypothetical protein
VSEIVEFDVAYNYSLLKVGIVVETILRYGDLEVEIDARIDTGSTYCLFERQFGERLGLEIDSGIPMPISTATGSFRVYGHRVEISALGMPFESTVYFAESEHFDRNVLGRIGWLDRVKLGLIESQGILYLAKVDHD